MQQGGVPGASVTSDATTGVGGVLHRLVVGGRLVETSNARTSIHIPRLQWSKGAPQGCASE